MSELIRLHGISFNELPHLAQGDRVIVIREEGKDWDSESLPAYSVRLDGLHIGYIPLVETLKEEALNARFKNLKKVWADGFEDMSRDQFREYVRAMKKAGELVEFHKWVKCTDEEARKIDRWKMDEADNAEYIRNWIMVEIERNRFIPVGKLLPLYYDKKEGRNTKEIGEVCSVSVAFNTECCGEDLLATQTGASLEAYNAAMRDYQ